VRFLDEFTRDVRYGLRVLRRAPATSVLAVVSVALGIGANTAVFSLLNALLLRPVSGVRAPHELVGIDTALPSTILDNLAKEPVFAGVCGVSTPLLTTEAHGDPQPIGILATTGGCTDTLGLKAKMGRMIQPADDREGSARVAVLTDSYWRSAFGGRADALGSTIRIDGVAFTIVGVAHPQFHGLLLGFWPGAMVPAAQDPSDAHVTSGSRHYSWVHVFARLRQGMSMEQARARLRFSQQRLLQESVPPDYQGTRRHEFLSQTLDLVSSATGLDYGLRSRFGRSVSVLLAISLLVLLVSCVNLANLLLARGVRRRRELAVRLAMGASRARVARQLAIESLLVVLTGTIFGSGLAYAADRVLMTQTQAAFINFSLSASPDLRVLAFAAAMALITGIGFGVLPAWRSSDVNMATSLKQASRGIQAGAAGRVLISVQVAFTLALVAGSSLFISSLDRLRHAPLGLQTGGVVEAQLFPVPHGYESFSPEVYYRDLLARVESLPGVESACYSNFAPLFGGGYPQPVRFTTDQEPDGRNAGAFWVSDGFLRTMSIPLLAGRDFERTGRAQGVRTAIVSKSLAKLLSPDERVVGRHIRVGTEPEDQDLEIIGIAADARLNNARAEQTPIAYINIWQYSYSAKYGVLVARTRSLSIGFIDLLRRTVRGAGHEYVEYARDLDQQRENSLLEERLLAWFSTAFGLLALLLAATGLYGLLAYHVASRTGEIGIRVALGATRANVRWLVIGEAVRLVSAGIAFGLLLTFIAGRFVQGFLYGVRAFEPGPVSVAVAVLASIAAVAAWVPAQRACAVDPLEALRHE
jgi:predicted permease